MDRLAGARYAVRGEIHRNVGKLQCFSPDARLGAPDHGTEPSDEFARAERLDHVVIGAAVEPTHPVGLLAARRQHNHRQRAGLRRPPEPATHFDSGDQRQHPVEQHDVRLALGDLDKRLFAVASLANLEALFFEVVAQHRNQRRLILDD